MSADKMADEVRQIQKVSWLFLGLALYALVIVFAGTPWPDILSPRVAMWTALIAGLVAGLGAIQCVVYLRRRGLELPGVTVAAAIIGGLTLIGSVLIVAYGFYSVAT
jgi:predicted membrane-bound spermidine synthase